jgi:hypothetical protein
MNNKYIPQVGDQVRWRGSLDNNTVTVTAVGRDNFLGVWTAPNSRETEVACSMDGNWIKVEPPPTYPEAWINVYPHVVASSNHSTRVAADNWALDHNTDDVPGFARIAVIHLASDGTVTLHPTTGGAS